jgi:RNA polymerase sigma-70 factor (ECF subfamily)
MDINKDIIQACIQQERAAQNKVYKVLLPYLRAVAYRYLKDTSYVKDVLQDSFIKIFKSIRGYDAKKASLKNWATRIVINTSLNYNDRVIGTSKEELVLLNAGILQTPQAIQNLSNEHLLYILKQMPDDYFKVFNLHIIDGYSHQEISVFLNISETLSRKRLSRARGWLKKTFYKNPDLINEINSMSFKLN